MTVELKTIDLGKAKIIALTGKGNILYNIDGNKVLVMKRMFNRACHTDMKIVDAVIQPLPQDESGKYIHNEPIYYIKVLSPF